MAENVEIGNVGGNGVASEITLARLTATMELMAKKKGVNPADITKKMQQVMDASSKIIKENNKATQDQTSEVKKSTTSLNKFSRTLAGITGSIFGSLGTSISGFAGALTKGSDQLEDYASQIPLIGGFLGSLASIIDTNISAFRTLANVGAIFGDGLTDIRRIAVTAGVPLGEFTELVAGNAERMKYFGGTVAQGATAFAKMSKELRTGPGRQFMMLGYTATELNEALLDYSEYNARQIGTDRRNNQLSATGAANYLKTIDQLAVVTGKRRDQLREELAENLADQRVRSALAGMSKEQGDAFNASLTQASLAGPALKEAIIDMADGFANDPFTAVLNSRSATFAKSASNLENMTTLERNNFFRDVASEAQAYSDGLGKSLEGVLKGGGPAGDMAQLAAQMAGKYALITQEQIDAQTKASLAEKQRNDGLKTFHDTIRQITTGLQTILTNQKMGDDGKPIAGSSILERITSAFSAIADTLGEFIASDVFKTGLANFTQNIQEFIDNFSTFGLGTSLFGGKGIDDDGKEVEIKGLMGDLFGEGGTFAGIMDSLVQGIKSGVGEGVSNFMSDLLDFEIPWGTLFVGGLIGIGAAIAAPVLAIPAGIAAAIVAVFGIQFMKDLLSDAWDGLKAAFTWTAEVAPFFVSGISGLFGAAWESITSIFDFGEEGFSFSKLFDNAWTEVKLLFSFTGSTILGLGDLMDTAWTTITGYMGFGDKTWSFSTLFGEVWKSITRIFTFGEEGFSFSVLFNNAWKEVKLLFSFAGSTILGLGDLMDTAWTTVTGWMGFGDKTWSFGTLFGEVWKTITGFFSFGSSKEGEEGFSFLGLIKGGWKKVEEMFSFKDFEFPSITSLFDGLWTKLSSFFDFDFEFPSFKSFIPAWMGGGDDSVVDPASGSVSIDPSVATTGANVLMDTQSALVSFSTIQGLENNLNAIKNGLDIDGVTSYTEAMQKLVEVLGELNDELNKDNYTGPGHGTNAGTVVDKMQTIGSSGGGSSEQLNNTMQQVLLLLTQMRDLDIKVEGNTRNIVGSNLARSGVTAMPG